MERKRADGKEKSRRKRQARPRAQRSCSGLNHLRKLPVFRGVVAVVRVYRQTDREVPVYGGVVAVVRLYIYRQTDRQTDYSTCAFVHTYRLTRFIRASISTTRTHTYIYTLSSKRGQRDEICPWRSCRHEPSIHTVAISLGRWCMLWVNVSGHSSCTDRQMCGGWRRRLKMIVHTHG